MNSEIIYTIFSFPKGILLLVKSNFLLKEITFFPSLNRVSPYLNYLESKFAGNISKSDLNFEKEIYLLSRYFKGEPISFDSLSLDFNMGTPFQRRVWKETRKIPFGQTSSYKELALKINHSGFRSVGQALGRNPFLLVVPCHRVLSSDGSLGGFSAGLPLKKYLLSLEQARQ